MIVNWVPRLSTLINILGIYTDLLIHEFLNLIYSYYCNILLCYVDCLFIMVKLIN